MSFPFGTFLAFRLSFNGFYFSFFAKCRVNVGMMFNWYALGPLHSLVSSNS